METKKFSDVAFHAIPKSRRANFFLYHNPQSVKRVLALLEKENKIPGSDSPS
jgi:hypothetical protein